MHYTTAVTITPLLLNHCWCKRRKEERCRGRREIEVTRCFRKNLFQNTLLSKFYSENYVLEISKNSRNLILKFPYRSQNFRKSVLKVLEMTFLKISKWINQKLFKN